MCASKKLTHTHGYHDLYFRVALSVVSSHIIIAFGEKESFFELLVMPDYYRSLLVSALIAFILVTVVNLFTVRLDRKYKWEQYPLQRTLLQVSLGLLTPSVLAFLLAFAYFRAFGLYIFDTLYLKLDFPVIVLMLVLLNVYYLAYYFYHQWKLAARGEGMGAITETPIVNIKNNRETFLVHRGAETIPLPAETIAYFYRDGDYNYLVTFDQEKYLVSQALDDVEAQLDKKFFFRANRKFVVQRRACVHFSALDHGKLELVVSPATNEAVVISQRRAKSFKGWMGS